MKRVVALAAVALGIALAGCERVIGADFSATAHSCKHKGPPERPAVQNAGGSDEDTWAAITTLEVGEGLLADGSRLHREIGFDLDNSCSNIGQRPTCKGFAWADPRQTDGIDGIDNNGGALMAAQRSVFSIDQFQSAAVTQKTKEGTVAPLAILRIRGYNTRIEDDDVELDWYVAESFGSVPDLKSVPAWPIWEESVDTSNVPPPPAQPVGVSRFRDPHAYVKDYTLVARLPPGTPLKLQNTPFISEGLLVVLTLGYGPVSVTEGTIAGHVKAAELFKKMPQMVVNFDAPLLCTNDSQYPKVKRYFCAHIDAHADGRDDPNAPCDAISLGMRLETTAIRPGPLQPDPVFEGCKADVDPGRANCATPELP